MKRLAIVVLRILIVAALFLSGSSLAIQTASASPTACSSPLADTIWTLANSPYLCSSVVTVPAGVTLTIDPGVSIQFAANAGYKFNVQGALVANGTAAAPVVISGVAASKGSWGGISAVGSALLPAHVTLNYATLDYGGVGGSSGAQVYADHALVSLNHSLIRNSAGNGVYVSISAQLDAHVTSFVDNVQNAIQLNQPSTDLLMTDLTASGNGTNSVCLVGSAAFHGLKRWTNPGIPYLIEASVLTDVGDVLTIEPGNTLQFTSSGWLYTRGRLNAMGTAAKPILLTGQVQTPGSWLGLFIDGGVHQALAQLDYVTIEYAGSGIAGANIHVVNGRLIVAHSIIRNSLHDGIRFDSNWGGSIMDSQIVNNAGYAVYNGTTARAVLATNNWWGDASGPMSDVVGCNVGAVGAKITAGVLFSPVLSAAGGPSPFPLTSAPYVTLSPRRWFAPADGLTRITFDITVRDGNGAALPGRSVKLSISGSASVTDGGVSDQNGKTLAFLTSGSVGDVVVNASITNGGCEGALSPETTVTFTTPFSGTDLMPDAPASYFDGDISVSPLPVIAGVPTTITAKLSNPLATAITMDVAFNYAQAGIGLVFGPIKELKGQVIPAHSSVFLSALLPAALSGHYCVEVTYSITAVGLASVLQPQAGSGRRQLNLYAQAGSLGYPSAKETLRRADTSFKLVSKIPSGPTQIQKGILGKWWGFMFGTTMDCTTALGLDPPRQDYNVITLPVRHPIPAVVADGTNVSVARAAAMNAVNAALTDMEAYGTAAATAMDRYGGASEANNLQWASEQANEQIFFQQQFGTALLNFADKLDAFVALLQSEGETQITLSLSDVTTYQQRLTTTGFSAQEIADAKLIGWTDARIEAYRLEIIAAKPADLTGSLLEKYTDLALASRDLGNALLHPPIFNPGFSVTGHTGSARSAENLQAAAGNTMAQIYSSVSTIQLANPLLTTQTVSVSARRIDLPADWTVDVSPAQISLTPGQQTTVTITVTPGSPVPQGSKPRVAIEGYALGQLLGGVVIDILVPNYQPFDGKLHLYLALARK